MSKKSQPAMGAAQIELEQASLNLNNAKRKLESAQKYHEICIEQHDAARRKFNDTFMAIKNANVRSS
jgi:hypothetical protein